MYKGFLLFFIATSIYAKQVPCPTVEEIKLGKTPNWLYFKRDSERLADMKDVKRFRDTITVFDSARWHIHYFANAHCIYAGTDPIATRIVLGWQPLEPTKQPGWIWIKPKIFAECVSSNVIDCLFVPT